MPIVRPNEFPVFGPASKLHPKNGRISPLAGNETADPKIFNKRVLGPTNASIRPVLGVGRGESLIASTGVQANDRVATPVVDRMYSTRVNVSRQLRLPAVIQVGPVGLVRADGRVPEIQPHEHGTFFHTAVLPVDRRAGGPDPRNSTPFHPHRKNAQVSGTGRIPIPAPKPRTAKAGERLKVSSFRNSFDGAGRWSQVKRGAAG